MKIEHEDNLTRYVLHQSDLNTFLTCPERARQLWTGEATDFTSGEAAIGTATHFAIELFLRQQGIVTPAQALEAAVWQFRGLSEQPDFRWVGIKTVATSEQHITNCFNTFLRDIYPLLGPPLAVEQKFRLFLWRDPEDRYEIWVEGTIDFIDECSVWDWKTCSRISKFTTDGWQLKRYAVQPSMYTFAAFELGYFEGDEIPFTYAAMQRTPCTSAVLPVTRNQRDWGWLKAQCIQVVEMHRADTRPRWPLNDQHALCSAKWCPAWRNCKGRHIDVPQDVTHSGLSLTASG